ncbi:MAG: mechanosensitive ion channel [Chitinophagales bacterium]
MDFIKEIPLSMLMLIVVIGILIFLAFNLYKKLMLPTLLKRDDAAQKKLDRVELLVWGGFFEVVIYYCLKTSLLVTSVWLFLILVVFFDFWRNFFAGIVLRFGGHFQLGDSITFNGYSGRVTHFGNSTLKMVTAEGEEILSPYRLVNKEVKIAQKNKPKTVFKTLKIEDLSENASDLQQVISNVVYANPWIVVSQPVEITIQNGGATLGFWVLNNDFFEKAKRRLLEDLGAN